jgi:hypothetical protein
VVILRTLKDAEGGTAARRDLAAAAGEKRPEEPSGTFKRALATLIEATKVEPSGRRYKITEDGRKAVPPEL